MPRQGTRWRHHEFRDGSRFFLKQLCNGNDVGLLEAVGYSTLAFGLGEQVNVHGVTGIADSTISNNSTSFRRWRDRQYGTNRYPKESGIRSNRDDDD